MSIKIKDYFMTITTVEPPLMVTSATASSLQWPLSSVPQGGHCGEVWLYYKRLKYCTEYFTAGLTIRTATCTGRENENLQTFLGHNYSEPNGNRITTLSQSEKVIFLGRDHCSIYKSWDQLKMKLINFSQI